MRFTQVLELGDGTKIGALAEDGSIWVYSQATYVFRSDSGVRERQLVQAGSWERLPDPDADA